jgi:hypothetical protein
MRRRTKVILISAIIFMIVFVTFPIWGMGPAVFLDSRRAVLSRAVSPDGRRIAQVERIIVGGVPSIVVMVRPSWMPNWYLAGCAAASHYQDAEAHVRWATNGAIEVRHTDSNLYWDKGSAPFHNDTCENLIVNFNQERL